MDAVEATAVARKYVESKFPTCTDFRPVKVGPAKELGDPALAKSDDYVVSCNFRVRFKSKVHTLNVRVASDGKVRAEDLPATLE